MPRKSAAELAIVTPATTATSPRLTPPASLSSDERLEFVAIADENSHLRRTDAPMLGCYVTAVTRVQKLARSKDVASWERATKTMLALARSLRLTQQSCTDPKTLTRSRSKPDYAAILAEMNGEAPSADFRSEAQKAEGVVFDHHQKGGDDDDA
jgi:hypothetical protein